MNAPLHFLAGLQLLAGRYVLAGLYLLAGLAIVLSLPSTAVAEAGRWTRHRLPQPGQPTAGFVCEVQMIDPDNYGYLPLQLTATATAGQFTADRKITVDLLPRDGANWPRPQAAYHVDLDLPQGQSGVTTVHHLPKYFVGASFEIVLSEGGKVLDGYALRHHSKHADRQLIAAALERLVRYAVILPDASVTTAAPGTRVPDMRSIDSLELPDISYLMSAEVERLDDAEALANMQLKSTPVRQLMRASETHSTWLGYESVDVVIVSFGVLQGMRDEHPDRFKALREWVACGGAVWTYGVESRESLAELLETAPLAASDPQVAEEIRTAVVRLDSEHLIPPYDWFMQQLQEREWTEEESNYMTASAGERWREWSATGHPVAKTFTASELQDVLYPQPVMAGIVIGIQDPDPFPGAFQFWHVAKHLTASRQVWQLKHGTTVLSGTDRFWNWSLENVARPPVYAFLGVLTGFVLLVGPISYHFTRRSGRTYLMFLIAPVLATVATLMLFGYGLVADGLGTQVRVRQITWADGVSGRAARLTRGTYFAGFRPGSGLRFPLDAAVYPIVDAEEAGVNATHDPPKIDRHLTIRSQHQQFAGEFMPARRQRQFVATQPLGEAGGIAFTQPAGQLPGLRNEMDVDLYQLVARDADGNYYTTPGSILAGEVSAADPISSNHAAALLRELYQVEPPSPPPGYRPSGGSRLFGSSYYYSLGSGGMQNHQLATWAEPHMEFGLFESRLRTMLADRAELPAGWFVGRAALDSDAIAVEEATPVSSVHYIFGGLR